MLYLLFVVVVPVVSTGSAVALLEGAFTRGSQPNRVRVLGAGGLLLGTGLLIFATATGSGYSGLAAFQELIVASAAALVGAVGLKFKPPSARPDVGLTPITAYP